MKRLNNIFDGICCMDNLVLADKKARKGKRNQHGIKVFDRDPVRNLLLLQKMLKERTYKTSEYSTTIIYEPKEREIFRLPYFPDRIAHHAIMNKLESIFTSMFTADTYSCIKGKGIHAALKNLKKALKDVPGTKYCLKMDIKKFYRNIDHDILKTLLRRKFKDKDLLWLLDEIIDSTPGVPIGNYLSQYFANFYMSGFDRWIKELKKRKYYFRYADDLVFLSDSKEDLHQLLADIREYLRIHLKLEIKGNYQIFPVDSRGIDFVGYPTFHTHVKIRPRIKRNFIRMLKRRKNKASIASYMGWFKHCNSVNLINKLLT